MTGERCLYGVVQIHQFSGQIASRESKPVQGAENEN